MNVLDKFKYKIDKLQQRYILISFPVAVIKKYSDDNAAKHAALITYFSFMSLFPLFLVFSTTVDLLSSNDPSLKARLIHGVIIYFPVLGQQIANNVHTLHRSGFYLVIGLLLTLYGARGVATSMQDASNDLWEVPSNRRPGFAPNLVRSLLLIIIGGIGLIATTTVTSFASGLGNYGSYDRILIILISFVLNFIVFTITFRLATAAHINTKDLLIGSATLAIFWQILQTFGSFLVLHELKNSSAVYGSFSLVLGLLFWLYLVAQAALYSIEINIVRVRKLWPVKLI